MLLTARIRLRHLRVCPLPHGNGGHTSGGVHPRPLQLRKRRQQSVFHFLTPHRPPGSAEADAAFSRGVQNKPGGRGHIALHPHEKDTGGQKNCRCQKHRQPAQKHRSCQKPFQRPVRAHPAAQTQRLSPLFAEGFQRPVIPPAHPEPGGQVADLYHVIKRDAPGIGCFQRRTRFRAGQLRLHHPVQRLPDIHVTPSGSALPRRFCRK